MIVILGEARAKAGLRDQLLAESRAHVARSRRENGFLDHRLSIDDADSERLVFVERWRDLASLQAHFARSETVAFGEACAKFGDGARLQILDATMIRAIG